MNIIDHAETLRALDHNVHIPAGNVVISIAVGEHSYCRPKVNALPFAAYERIELAVIEPPRPNDWIRFIVPESCEMSGIKAPWLNRFAHLFGSDQVAGYITWEDAQAIVDAACDAAESETV